MKDRTVMWEKREGLATVTFNRPDKLNALNQKMLEELGAALAAVELDPSIRVLLLTGAGRAFMAGADIAVFRGLDPLGGKRLAQEAHRLLLTLERLEIPVVAAVHGYALGGGLELAMACDVIYAADDARFGQPEINLGLIPCFGGTQRLSRLVGQAAAKELCLTGRLIDAAEAQSLGLVARVFPAASFREEVRRSVQTLAAKPRAALRAIKQVIDRGAHLDLAAGLALEAEAFAVCLASPDAQEGVTAFLEKRPPRFLDSLP